MKKISLLMGLLLICSVITFAQERGGGQRPSRSAEQGRPAPRGDRPQMTPEQMQQRQTQRLVEQLKLNKDQEAKVTAINKKYSEKNPVDFSRMMDASDEERTKMMETMRKVQAERDKEIKAVLTPAQVKLYDDMQKQRGEGMRRNGPGGPGGPGGMGGFRQ